MRMNEMQKSKGNVVVAGVTYAGIDENWVEKFEYALVIEFKSEEEWGKAIEDRSVEFTLFGDE